MPTRSPAHADIGGDDYDLDAGTLNPDYDGSQTSDWILYVDSVQQTRFRECGAAIVPTATPTATATPTDTPTPPPPAPTATPTPFTICDDFTMDQLFRRSSAPNRLETDINNDTPFRAYLTQTTIEWDDTEGQSSNPYINYLWLDGNCYDQYWNDNITDSPFTGVGPPYADPSPPGHNADCSDWEVQVDAWDDDQDWEAHLDWGESWIGTTCVQLDFTFPDAGNETCSVSDCITLSMNTPTVTPTVPTPTPSNTYTPTTPTATYTPSNTSTPTTPTVTYTPSNTSTPYTPTRTNTYAPATNTPTTATAPTNTPPPPPTNTPTEEQG